MNFFLSLKKKYSLFLAVLIFQIMSAQNIKEFQSNFPDSNYQKGVSGHFSGIFNDTYLMMAGGCNFPDLPPSEGGKKEFYKSIFIAKDFAESKKLNWEKIGELPEELAYGYGLQFGRSVIILGGENERIQSKKVFVLSLENQKIKIENWPDLPETLNNFTAVIAQEFLYVLGGNKNGKASHSFLRLNLNKIQAGWEILPDFPGNPRTQAVAFSDEKNIYLAGGFALGYEELPPSLNTDYLTFNLENQSWENPQPIMIDSEKRSVGGGFAVNTDAETAYVSGGVNAEIFFKALKRIHETNLLLKKEPKSPKIEENQKQGKIYLSQEASWYQFNPYLIKFKKGEIADFYLKDDRLRRAGASMVSFGNSIFVIMGEIKPGVRTPSILHIKLNQ